MPKVGIPAVPSDDHVVLQTYFDLVLRADGIVWLKRTAEVYPSVDAIHRAYGEFLKVVDDWSFDRRIKSGGLGTRTKTPMAWLCDLRYAPSRRNDPEFEKAVEDRRPDLLKRSPVLTVLVQSASGKMQLTRMSRTGKANLMVFDDFEEAVRACTKRMQEEF
jgi:hypothetical protein